MISLLEEVRFPTVIVFRVFGGLLGLASLFVIKKLARSQGCFRYDGVL